MNLGYRKIFQSSNAPGASSVYYFPESTMELVWNAISERSLKGEADNSAQWKYIYSYYYGGLRMSWFFPLGLRITL